MTASKGQTASAEFAGCVLVACILTLVDFAGAAQRPLPPSSGGLLIAALAGVSLGAFVAATVLVARGALARRLRARVAGGAAFAGIVDALGLLVLAVYLQDPRVVAEPNLRMLVTVAALLVGGFVAWAWERFLTSRPTVDRVAAGCVALGALWAMGLLRWNGDVWFRLALHAVFAVAVTRCTLPWLRRVARPRAVGAVGVALACAVVFAWTVLLPGSAQARRAMYAESSHARAWCYAVERAFGATASGDARVIAVVPGARPNAAPPLHGAARGADVFLFSVDSLRWDAIRELRPLRDALGPHVEFSLAVSPAPATRDSLASTLRGRAASELVIGPAPGARGEILWRDPSPTLGHVLSRAGYRAVTIPTNNQADPRLGIHSGFDTVWTVNHDGVSAPLIRSPFKLSYTRGHEITPAARQLARDTPGPLLLWIHFMEPHYSYHWSPTEEGPRGIAAYRHAVRYEAELLAGLVKDLRAIRARPAVVSVFGDHGEEFREHGGEFHGTTVHAEQARVAFLLASPGVTARRVTTPVSTAALPATILDLLGLATPASMTVPSLPLASDTPWPTCAATELRSDYRAAVGYTMGAWRLLRNARHDFEQLFDLSGDPYEKRDLAEARPADLARARELARRCPGAPL